MTSHSIFKQFMNLRVFSLALLAFVFSWSGTRSAASQNLPQMAAALAPKGWQIFDKVKQFTPENVYEQINGRASFFQAYDMIGLTYVSFVKKDEDTKFVNLSIYDMGSPTNAFGVFSSERSPGEPTLKLGRASYRSDANYFIWQGQYYIQIFGSEATDEFKHIGLDLARSVTDALPDSGEQVWGLAALPRTDLVPESVQYFKADALGLEFMRNTYTAEYRKGNVVVTAFLSRQESADSARLKVAKYAEYAKRYGKGFERLKNRNVELVSCDMDGSYDMVFNKGRLVGGVSSVENRDLAVRAAMELWEQLHLE